MDSKDDFFVGYLKMPGGLSGFLAIVAAFLVIVTAGTAYMLATAQGRTGTGVWEIETTTVTGRIAFNPYPVIYRRTAEGSVETLLTVTTGKISSEDRARPFDGQMVEAEGVVIERGGRIMLELIDGPDAIKPVDASSEGLDTPQAVPLGTVTLRGEIVDSKCYLGVMKPGQGKTHKACATLCIIGGIPPIFVVRHSRDPDDYTAYLMTGPNGEPLKDEILDFVADPVSATGELEKVGDLNVFRVASDTINRLAP